MLSELYPLLLTHFVIFTIVVLCAEFFTRAARSYLWALIAFSGLTSLSLMRLALTRPGSELLMGLILLFYCAAVAGGINHLTSKHLVTTAKLLVPESVPLLLTAILITTLLVGLLAMVMITILTT